MRSYLVETYVPRSRAADAQAAGRRVESAAASLSGRGVVVRYVRTTLLPDDETCFHLVEAPSADAVRELCRLADLAHARIVGAVET
jgi:uncharacterized protein DUF4242